MSDIKIIISGINDAYFIIPHILAKSTHHPSNKKPRYWAGLELSKRRFIPV